VAGTSALCRVRDCNWVVGARDSSGALSGVIFGWGGRRDGSTLCHVPSPTWLEEEGSGIVRRWSVRRSVVVTLAVCGLPSCGTPGPSHTAAPSASATASVRPSAAAGPCASVLATTPIGQVSAACAAAWAPYGVTEVPPANLTDSTPVPPSVVNGTSGAVTDADVQAWAMAANRAAVWDRWAEKYDQAALLDHLLTRSLVPATELSAMSQGAQIDQPDCSSFGTRYAVFQLGPDGGALFSRLGQHPTARFVLAITYPGPCRIIATYPDGHQSALFSFTGSGTTVFAGSLRDDTALGTLWFSEAAADCSSQPVPAMWCTA
jgi:hypothetical protein